MPIAAPGRLLRPRVRGPSSFRWVPPPSWDCIPEQSDSGVKQCLTDILIHTFGSRSSYGALTLYGTPFQGNLNLEEDIHNAWLRDYNSKQHTVA